MGPAAEIVDHSHYAAHGYPYARWAELRKSNPVAWVEPRTTRPFWAVTRHADIVRASRQPTVFLNAPRFLVNPEVKRADRGRPERHLLNMDPPEHGLYRRLVSAHFTPRALRRYEPRIEALARQLLDGVEGEERDGNFVDDVSAWLPLAVIAELLGVPETDWPRLRRWTDEIAGAADPEYQLGRSVGETLDRAQGELFAYFAALAAERKERPRDDLVSVLATATIAGDVVPEHDLLSYFFVLVAAGNETTRNATTGGLLALLEHPDQLARLRAEPALLPGAVEEILRWTSPVVHFCRTAARDAELGGEKIRAGESLALFYPSANRDETVFDAPDRFRIDRRPNPHVAFGIGEHFCLGAHLARLELRVLFRELLPRLQGAEVAGPVLRLRSCFLGGIKQLPLRYRIGPAPAA